MASTDITEHYKSSHRGNSPVYHPWKTKWVLSNREIDNGYLNRISIPLSMWYNFSHIWLWNAYGCLYGPSLSPVNYVWNIPDSQVPQTWHLTRWLYHQQICWLQPYSPIGELSSIELNCLHWRATDEMQLPSHQRVTTTLPRDAHQWEDP